MIIGQLRLDIGSVLTDFLARSPNYNAVPPRLQVSIEAVRNFLKEEDPVQICKNVKDYVATIRTSIFDWWPFSAIHQFIRAINDVLEQQHYQEVELLKALIEEKNQQLAAKNSPSELEKKNKSLQDELERIKLENQFWFNLAIENDKKITQLMAEKFNLSEELKKMTSVKKSLEQQYKEGIDSSSKFYNYH